MNNWDEVRLEEMKFEWDQNEQSRKILKVVEGRRSLPVADVIEIQRKKAVATWEKCRHG